MKKRSRRNPYSALLALFFAGLLVFPQGLGSETLTMSTSYPAPMGIYKTIMTTGGTVASPANTLLNRDAGQVGIGTGNPLAALDVESTSSAYPAGRFVSTQNTGLYAEADGTAAYAGNFVGNNGYGIVAQSNNASSSAEYAVNYLGNSITGFSGGNGSWAAYFNSNNGPGLIATSEGVNQAGEFCNGSSWSTICTGNYALLAWINYALYGRGDGYLSGNLSIGGVYTGNGSGLSALPSDRRLKDNIRPILDPLHKVLALDPVSFQWKKDSQQREITKGTDFGFVAQEVEKVIPEAVGEMKTADHGKDTLESKLGTIKTLTYVRLIPFLAGAMQQFYREFTDQKGELQALRAENKRLNERVSSLETRLDKLAKSGTVASLSKEDR